MFRTGRRETPGRPDLRGPKGIQAQQAHRVRKEILEQPDHRDLRVIPEPPEQQVLRVPKATRG